MCVSHSLLGHILTSQRLVFDVSWAQLEEAVCHGDVVSDSLQFDLQPLPRHLRRIVDFEFDDLPDGPIIMEGSFFRQRNHGSIPWCGFPASLLVFCRCGHLGVMHATACIANARREVVVVLDGITLTLRSTSWDREEWERVRDAEDPSFDDPTEDVDIEGFAVLSAAMQRLRNHRR